MKRASLIALGIIVGTTLGAQGAFAFGGGGFGGGKFFHGGDREGLVTTEMRHEWRVEYQDLTNEERQAKHEEMKANRAEYRAEKREAIEGFTGLTSTELKEARRAGESMGDILTKQGITESDAEVFLTDRANDKVDSIVERKDLDAEDEQTLRDRISTFLQNILSKWFGSDT